MVSPLLVLRLNARLDRPRHDMQIDGQGAAKTCLLAVALNGINCVARVKKRSKNHRQHQKGAGQPSRSSYYPWQHLELFNNNLRKLGRMVFSNARDSNGNLTGHRLVHSRNLALGLRNETRLTGIGILANGPIQGKASE
jgi:hypothetical protein